MDRSDQIPLRILTYNVHLLPDIAADIAGRRSGSDYRAGAIAQHLDPYDIIGINEAFDRKHTRKLISGVQSNSSGEFQLARGPARSGRHLVGSGLLLLNFLITSP